MKHPVLVNKNPNGLLFTGAVQVGERRSNWEIYVGATPDGAKALLRADGSTVDITEELMEFLVGSVMTVAVQSYQDSGKQAPVHKDGIDPAVQVALAS